MISSVEANVSFGSPSISAFVELMTINVLSEENRLVPCCSISRSHSNSSK